MARGSGVTGHFLDLAGARCPGRAAGLRLGFISPSLRFQVLTAGSRIS